MHSKQSEWPSKVDAAPLGIDLRKPPYQTPDRIILPHLLTKKEAGSEEFDIFFLSSEL